MNEISEPYEGFFIKWRTKGPNKKWRTFDMKDFQIHLSERKCPMTSSRDEVAGREFEL